MYNPDVLNNLKPYIQALQNASSLNETEAKLCVYYCMLTHKVKESSTFPILTIFGDYGTGKSSIMKELAQLVYCPIPEPDFNNLNNWEGLKINDTFPSLRDALKADTTAFIEEGDASYKKNESLIADRYSRQSSVVRFKEQKTIGYGQVITA